MNEQISIFEYIGDPRARIYKTSKKIRLIEMFGGIGSQAMALRDMGADFETWKLIEYDKYPIASYNAIHGTNYKPMDIRNVHGRDLEIVNKESFTYLLTYLLVSLPRLINQRFNAWHDQRHINEKWTSLGSRANTNRT